jgi:DNA-binding response OmpR family regulator
MYADDARSHRVLVVDDEPAIRELLTDALRSDGLDAIAAATAGDAASSARRCRPDIVVADIALPDGNGLDLVQQLRRTSPDLPAVLITGAGDAATLTAASRLRPVEILAKPLDVERLNRIVREELRRMDSYRRVQRRTRRLRDLSRTVGRKRRRAYKTLCDTCADLAGSCRDLQTQLERQQALSEYQTDLIGSVTEDDIFLRLFRLFVKRSGPVFGAAQLCDEYAELQLVGRFGVPVPDGVNFCRDLSLAVLPMVLERPEVTVLDATQEIDLFPEHLHRMLIGVTLLAVPLMVGEGKMIGLVVLYRKGEQPFTEDDISIARLIAPPTAAAAQKT